MWSFYHHVCDQEVRRQRVVCHACGAKGPELDPAGMAHGPICGCREPDLHLHCLHHSCEACRDVEVTI